jgi:hypothetical protein
MPVGPLDTAQSRAYHIGMDRAIGATQNSFYRRTQREVLSMNTDEMRKFEDWNYPGVLYVGTEDHFEGLNLNGGCPRWVSDAKAIQLMQRGDACDPRPWSLRSAPDFWAEEARSARSAAEIR